MPSTPARVLYVTDLTYPARGRRYCDEDIYLTSRLREDFGLALCHPLDAVALMDSFAAVVVRNSGAVLHYQAQYDEFRGHAIRSGARVYNQLSGKADMVGKQYLLDLSVAGFPVIPTVGRAQDANRLPEAREYVVKPMFGADSIGLEFVSRDRLSDELFEDVLVQPRIDFDYEVSFYFIDHDFQYALYAPRTDRRWALEPYEPTADDLAFAQRFIDWNGIDRGIQRVDACRIPDGGLLLVELEDLNPYLSLDVLDEETRTSFVANLKASLHAFLGAAPPS